MCIYIYISIYRSVYLSTYLCIHLSMYPSIDRSIYLCIYVSLSLYIYIYIHLSIGLSIHPAGKRPRACQHFTLTRSISSFSRASSMFFFLLLLFIFLFYFILLFFSFLLFSFVSRASRMHTYAYVYVYVYVSVYVYAYVYVCVYIYIYIHECIWVYGCVYIYIYIYIYHTEELLRGGTARLTAPCLIRPPLLSTTLLVSCGYFNLCYTSLARRADQNHVRVLPAFRQPTFQTFTNKEQFPHFHINCCSLFQVSLLKRSRALCEELLKSMCGLYRHFNNLRFNN